MEIINFDIWKEEYDEISKLRLERGKADREISRRLLIWTEGFVLKCMNTDMNKLDERNMKILKDLREKNLAMMSKKKDEK